MYIIEVITTLYTEEDKEEHKCISKYGTKKEAMKRVKKIAKKIADEYADENEENVPPDMVRIFLFDSVTNKKVYSFFITSGIVTDFATHNIVYNSNMGYLNQWTKKSK